jgi:hypothetical protein
VTLNWKPFSKLVQRRITTMMMRYICAIVAMLILLAACGQAPTATPSTPPTNTPAPDPAQALVGSWTTTLTKEDLLRVVPDFKPEFLCDSAGTFVWQFNADGTFTIDQTALDGCPTPAQTHIESTWFNAGNLVTFAKGTPDQEEYEWSMEGELLAFKHVSGACIPCRAGNTANPWKRSEK